MSTEANKRAWQILNIVQTKGAGIDAGSDIKAKLMEWEEKDKLAGANEQAKKSSDSTFVTNPQQP
jgi:hypothetical protein